MTEANAKDAKCRLGRLTGRAGGEPVAVGKHGRSITVVMEVPEFERPKALDHLAATSGIGLYRQKEDNDR
jgi:hypothetical protein